MQTRKFNFLKHFALIILLFLALIGPQLSYGNHVVDLQNITLLALSLAALLRIIIKKKISKYYILFILLLSITFLYYFLIVSLNNFQDITAFKLIFLAIMNALAAFYLYEKYHDFYQDDALEKFFNDLIKIFLFDSIFVIMAYFNESVWNFAYHYLGGKHMEINKLVSNINISKRSCDIGIGSGAIASINFSIFYIISLIYYRKTYKTEVLLVAICLLLATAFLGRTGLLIEFIFTIFMLLLFIGKQIANLLVLSKKNFRNLLKIKINIFKKNFQIIGVFFIIIIILASTVSNSSQRQKFQDFTLPWILEAYYSFQTSGTLKTRSTDEILNRMYFMPKNQTILIMGNSNLGRSENFPYIPSDVGYVRSIFGFGLIGTFITYLPFLIFIFLGLKYKKKFSAKILFWTTLALILTNFKELHLLSGSYGLIMIVLYIDIRAERRKKFSN